MRPIIVLSFVSLDGVIQGPGDLQKIRVATSRAAVGPFRSSTRFLARPWPSK